MDENDISMYDHVTIETKVWTPAVGGPDYGFNVYGHDTFPERSVNAGMPRRCFLDWFETLEEAQAAYPTATTSSISRTEYTPSPTPPAWFDPAACGEVW